MPNCAVNMSHAGLSGSKPPSMVNRMKNHLYFGDNLDVLRKYITSESVDLVYLDPPFNSNRNYSVIFNKHGETDPDNTAQIEAFEDTWHWTPTTDQQYDKLIEEAPGPVVDALSAFRILLGKNDAMAYLVNMAPRLVELHRVLKPTGSLYLHCDPTMSHYLKVLLDGIFDARNFKNEVIWRRTGSHNSAKRWGPQHDVLLFFTKSSSYTWNRALQDYDTEYVIGKFKWEDERGSYQDVSLTGPGVRTGDSGLPWRGANPTASGRHWQPPSLMYEYYEELTGKSLADVPTMQERLDLVDQQGLIHWPKKQDGQPRFKQYLSISPGAPVQDIISDIDAINSQAAERLGYPTQKPVALLERIIAASSNPGDVVLDPFCGCGTTVDAAQKLGRQWVGIDITYISIDLIIKRLQHTYGDAIRDTFETTGIPQDYAAAQALFSKDAFEFERWAVSLIGAQPNERQVADQGVDGVGRFMLDGKGGIGKFLVSVKGGKTINPGMVRDLYGAVKTQGAAMGIFITLTPATRGVSDAVNQGGVWTHPITGQVFPALQHVTIKELMKGTRPQLPPTMFKPYIEAKKQKIKDQTGSLFEIN